MARAPMRVVCVSACVRGRGGGGATLTVTDDASVVRLQLFQGVQRILGGTRLPHAYGGVENQDRQNARRFHERLRRGWGFGETLGRFGYAGYTGTRVGLSTGDDALSSTAAATQSIARTKTTLNSSNTTIEQNHTDRNGSITASQHNLS